jgi:hypothetical protein
MQHTDNKIIKISSLLKKARAESLFARALTYAKMQFGLAK